MTMANFKACKNKKKRRSQQVKEIKWYKISGGRNRHSVTRTISNRRKAVSRRNTKGYLTDIC